MLARDGATWTARVVGRSGGRGAAPLLLIGFWRDEDAADGPHRREALLVGEELGRLSASVLTEALAGSADRAPPTESRAGPSRRT